MLMFEAIFVWLKYVRVRGEHGGAEALLTTAQKPY